jgi:hypothetical protein
LDALYVGSGRYPRERPGQMLIAFAVAPPPHRVVACDNPLIGAATGGIHPDE